MFWTAFFTAAVIELSNMGSGLIDGIIVSRLLGPASMAAEGIAHPFYSISSMVSGLLAVGMQSICSADLAHGKVKEMQRVFSMTAIVAFVMSVIATCLLFFGSDQVAMLLGARGNAAHLLPESSAYLRGLALGCIPSILSAVLCGAIQLDSGNRLIQTAALTGSFMDVVFDLFAVKTGMGMFGVGLATSVASCTNLLLLSLHFLKKDRMLRFTYTNLPWNCLGKMVSLGSEKATRRLANIIRPIVLNTIIISAGGALGMSALSIRNNIGNFLEIPMAGITGAVALLTKVAYSEQNKEECIAIGKLAHKYTYLYSAAVAVFTFLCSSQIASCYVREEGELKELVVFSTYILAIGIFFSTLVQSRTSYLQATRQLKKCQVLTLLSRLFAVVPCAFLCVQFWGNRGVIISFVLSDALICIGIMIFYYLKKDNKSKLPSVDDYMSLPEDFNIRPQDVIELTISNEEEAVLSAEQVQLFCKGHKMDREKAQNAALCLEEVTTNIIRYGFPRCKVIRPIDIRITISGDRIIMKIRDYCPKFDITQRISMIADDDDPTIHIGTKIVAKTAHTISYVNLLNTNTLLVEI